MTRDFADVPPRSLSGYRTAYPRASKRGTDPDNGLASVEALFLAHHILGRPTAGLLDHYRWADEFLRLNGLAEPKIDPFWTGYRRRANAAYDRGGRETEELLVKPGDLAVDRRVLID